MVFKCWYCKKEIAKDDIQIGKVGKVNRKFHKNNNCYKKFDDIRKQKELEKEIRDKENKEWDDLYQYVKKEILGYEECQNLSPFQIRILKQLRNGEYVVRNKQMVNRGYSYKVILFTFKFKKRDILAAIQGKTFNDEKHKFNYIMVIVNNSINDIYKRYLRTLKDKKDTVDDDINVSIEDKKKVFKSNMENKTDNKLVDLLKDLL